MKVILCSIVDKEVSIGDLVRKVESIENALNRSETKCKELIKENLKLKDTTDEYLLNVHSL